MENTINTRYFFTNEKFEKEVNLTQKEAKFLIDYQLNEEYVSGISGISGGFAIIILLKFDKEDSNIILGTLKVGVQSDCEDNVNTCNIRFNREDKVITFE